jgi:hypothetical protein
VKLTMKAEAQTRAQKIDPSRTHLTECWLMRNQTVADLKWVGAYCTCDDWSPEWD